ncbi:ISAzo13-like element transposase-related protein [Streptomyces sp. NBC_01077]|uniref:ISAzo13-like element transposase-related protein n=1 Tax=Streptomyces sp. NBC_01077 TaxID=2903746 RepID=UPI003863ADEA
MLRQEGSRTGLRVKAELDTNTYPTGVGVGDAEMAALPLTRHTFHGEWNYALHPQPSPAVPAARNGRPPTPPWHSALLSDPELTGLTPHQLQNLIHILAAKGLPRRGRPPRLTFADQVLATVLHLRVNLAAEPLAVLFNSSRTAMHRTLLKIRKLLEAQGIIISPAVIPPTALPALRARVAAQSSSPNSKIKAAG